MNKRMEIIRITDFNDFKAFCYISSLKFKSYKEKHHFGGHEHIILNKEYIKNIEVDMRIHFNTDKLYNTNEYTFEVINKNEKQRVFENGHQEFNRFCFDYDENTNSFSMYIGAEDIYTTYYQVLEFFDEESQLEFKNSLKNLEQAVIKDKEKREIKDRETFASNFDVFYLSSTNTADLPEFLKEYNKSLTYIVRKRKELVDIEYISYSDNFIIKNLSINKLEQYQKEYELYLSKKDADKKAKKELEEKRIEGLVQKAKETGERQVVYIYNEECNCKDLDCDIDNIIVYIDKYGGYTQERVHTY